MTHLYTVPKDPLPRKHTSWNSSLYLWILLSLRANDYSEQYTLHNGLLLIWVFCMSLAVVYTYTSCSIHVCCIWYHKHYTWNENWTTAGIIISDMQHIRVITKLIIMCIITCTHTHTHTQEWSLYPMYM